MIALTVLGCSGTYAAPGGACTGYLLTADGTRVWLDCGPGTLGQVQRHVGLDDIDAVVVSHSHPDHWLELPVLRNAVKYGSGREGLPVYGTAETLEGLEALVRDGIAPTFAWTTVDESSTVEVGPMRFTFSRTDHPVETLAVRVADEDGRSLAYSADTGPDWGFDRFGAPVDLALCEATLPNDMEGAAPHLSGRQAGAMAKAAAVGRLVVTHAWPTHDPKERGAEAAAAFGGPVEVASIGARYDVGGWEVGA